MLRNKICDIALLLCILNSNLNLALEFNYLQIHNTIPCQNDSVKYNISIGLIIRDFHKNVTVSFVVKNKYAPIKKCMIRIRNGHCKENYTDCTCITKEEQFFNFKIHSVQVNQYTYIITSVENCSRALQICDNNTLTNVSANLQKDIMPANIIIGAAFGGSVIVLGIIITIVFIKTETNCDIMYTETNSDKTPSDAHVSVSNSYIDVVEEIEVDENPYDEIVSSSSETTVSNEDNRNSYIDVIDVQETSDNIYDQVATNVTELNIYDGTFYIAADNLNSYASRETVL